MASFIPGDFVAKLAFALLVAVLAPRIGRAADWLWAQLVKRLSK